VAEGLSAAPHAHPAMMRTYLLCAAMVLATASGAGAVGDKDSMLQTSVAHDVPAVERAAATVAATHKIEHKAAAAKQSGLAALELQKKNGSQLAPSELHATQPTISARFKTVHDKQLAKIRLGEKALIGTYASPSAKHIADSLEYLPFILPPAGLLLLAIVTYGVVTIRNKHKIPSMPTQGRLDIKDVRASARAMESKV